MSKHVYDTSSEGERMVTESYLYLDFFSSQWMASTLRVDSSQRGDRSSVKFATGKIYDSLCKAIANLK